MSVRVESSKWSSSPPGGWTMSWITSSSNGSISNDGLPVDEDDADGGSVGGLMGLAVSHVLDHEDLNMTLTNISTEITQVSLDPHFQSHLSLRQQLIITCVYLFGILGNIAALYIITRKETTRYKKQALMLRCLACNDLMALVGSFILMHLSLYMNVGNARWFCAIRVICRSFGLGSGCIALVMALERWLALTHPFTYQRHVTYTVICRAILCLWLGNLVYVCAPFFGFGLWYCPIAYPDKPCVPYKFGTSIMDRAYAYGWFVFGMVMCICIVLCNMCVIRVMCRLRSQLTVPRRHSRSSSRSNSSLQDPLAAQNAPNCEELAFAKLMALLSIFFVICWVPQLTMILVAQLGNLPRASRIYRVADIFIALNFSLDPYMYVLFRRRGGCSSRHIRKVVTSCLRQQPEETSSRAAVSNGSARHSSQQHMGGSSTTYSKQTSVSANSGSSEKEYVPLHLLLDGKNKAVEKEEYLSNLLNSDENLEGINSSTSFTQHSEQVNGLNRDVEENDYLRNQVDGHVDIKGMTPITSLTTNPIGLHLGVMHPLTLSPDQGEFHVKHPNSQVDSKEIMGECFL